MLLLTPVENISLKRIDILSELVYEDFNVLLDDLFLIEWKTLLRAQLLEERKRSCEFCGSSTKPLEFHHGILTRRDAQNARWYPMIEVKENLFLICIDCHKPQPPSRDACWAKACWRYGRKTVEEWYLNLPYKLKKPPRYFL